mmetsp:Transcript_18195/g.41329  ORF Transcript_18195/g.41329 Transcript_18195/m.41329 type:complete len:83 (+) Transcript_18195:234-482(+)
MRKEKEVFLTIPKKFLRKGKMELQRMLRKEEKEEKEEEKARMEKQKRVDWWRTRVQEGVGQGLTEKTRRTSSLHMRREQEIR